MVWPYLFSLSFIFNVSLALEPIAENINFIKWYVLTVTVLMFEVVNALIKK